MQRKGGQRLVHALLQQHGGIQQQARCGNGIQHLGGLAGQNAFKAGVEAHGNAAPYLISFVIISFEII
ncbi:hypothetical protein SDC9_114800 [bioreactor metagenome]|uniref:Uncharacterized protein n=1 Tax=bioreactor metagenome TaxID=1076179 RepID=A0A645BRC6_9ZZZZ